MDGQRRCSDFCPRQGIGSSIGVTHRGSSTKFYTHLNYTRYAIIHERYGVEEVLTPMSVFPNFTASERPPRDVRVSHVNRKTWSQNLDVSPGVCGGPVNSRFLYCTFIGFTSVLRSPTIQRSVLVPFLLVKIPYLVTDLSYVRNLSPCKFT